MTEFSKVELCLSGGIPSAFLTKQLDPLSPLSVSLLCSQVVHRQISMIDESHRKAVVAIEFMPQTLEADVLCVWQCKLQQGKYMNIYIYMIIYDNI